MLSVVRPLRVWLGAQVLAITMKWFVVVGSEIKNLNTFLISMLEYTKPSHKWPHFTQIVPNLFYHELICSNTYLITDNSCTLLMRVSIRLAELSQNYHSPCGWLDVVSPVCIANAQLLISWSVSLEIMLLHSNIHLKWFYFPQTVQSSIFLKPEINSMF